MNRLPSQKRLDELMEIADQLAPLWSITQVAEYMGITWGSVHKLIERQSFPYFRIDGKLRFDCLVVAEWVVKKHRTKRVRCRCRGQKL